MLTKKQKEERAAAEIRKQALLASGVQIEGLQRQGGGASSRKVTYGNRKRTATPSVSTGSRAVSPSPAPEDVVTPPPASPTPVESVVGITEETPTPVDTKDDWEASSADEDKATKSVPGVKDDWDDSTDEESKPEKPVEKPAKSTTKAGAPAAKKAEAKAPGGL